MRVAMYYSNSDIRVQEMPKPRIGPGELLMKVKACGVCGGDVMEWYRAGKAPLVLGHEAAGEIAEVGTGVKQYRVGDRIVARRSHARPPCGATVRQPNRQAPQLPSPLRRIRVRT